MFLLSLLQHLPLSKRHFFKCFVICLFFIVICCIPPVRNVKSVFKSCVFFVNVKLIGYINKFLCLLKLSKLKEIPIASNDELLPQVDYLNEMFDWLAVKEIMTIIQIWSGLHQTVKFCFRRDEKMKSEYSPNGIDQQQKSNVNWNNNFTQVIENIKIPWKYVVPQSNLLGRFWFRNRILYNDEKSKQIQRHFSYNQNNNIKTKRANSKFGSNFFVFFSSLKQISSKMTNWMWDLYQIGNNFIGNTKGLCILESKRADKLM